jgi:hypothetical protein
MSSRSAKTAFASVECFPHLPAAGKYIGGKIW